MEKLLNQIQGGMFGLAIGDALGCTVEFMKPEHIKRVFGIHKEIVGGGVFHFEKGEVTDDTDMSLCVAKGIIKEPFNPIPEIGQEFLNWLDSNPKDVGMTVRQSLINYIHMEDWEEASLKTHLSLNGKSAGNGSLMRCLPIGIAYTDKHRITRLSVKQSRLTHYDELAAEYCVLYNQISRMILEGTSLKDSLLHSLSNSTSLYSLTEKPSNPPDAFVKHTFEWMVYILNNTNNYEEAIVEAVNLGHDADTLGAVVGGLAGLYYGYNSIPQRYIDEILLKSELEKISYQLLNVRNANS